MSTPKRAFIAYNSTITGGKALRALNNSDYIQKQLYDSDNENMMKCYCKQYDTSGKKNEPYYDVLASQISQLTPDLFDKYFEYVPVSLVKTGTNMNGFHPEHDDNMIFKMKSDSFKDKSVLSKLEFNEYYNYNDLTTEHIFIYGPITDSIYMDLLIEIKANKNNLIIHLQGENILDDLGKDGDTIFGIESKGNLFSNSFNYQNNMKNANKLRELIQTEKSCQAFTIRCKIESDLCLNNIGDEELLWPLKGDRKEIKNGLPKIYIKFYEDIKKLIDGKFDDYTNYNKINTTYIYQDMVDKDNMSSIAFLVINSINEPLVSLIGRETFMLMNSDVKVKNYQALHLPNIPECIRPDGVEKIELDFGKTKKSYWPAFKNTNYDLKYDKEMTLYHYYLMANCFKICTNDLLKLYTSKKIYYVYNESLITNPSSDENHMPLLNEILFFPSLNTYIMCINKFDNILESFNSELLEINKQTNYKSDLDLTMIIKLWLDK